MKNKTKLAQIKGTLTLNTLGRTFHKRLTATCCSVKSSFVEASSLNDNDKSVYREGGEGGD